MIITSSSFDDGAAIPRKFTCDGGDMNPELLIQFVPPETKSLALVMHDPDAPIKGGFTHWTVWDIDPMTSIIKEESIPPGSVEGANGAGKTGWFGPCPPPGAPHHYHFMLFALDVATLGLPEGAPVPDVKEAIDKHIVAKAELIGTYGRSR